MIKHGYMSYKVLNVLVIRGAGSSLKFGVEGGLVVRLSKITFDRYSILSLSTLY